MYFHEADTLVTTRKLRVDSAMNNKLCKVFVVSTKSTMLNRMVQSDLVTYRGGTIVILFLQATIRLGKEPDRWSYFSPKLTEEELELVKRRDRNYLQNFVSKVRLVFQSEITVWTFVESLKIISKLKFFQTLDQSLPRNSF